jgi:hypothetical protein
VSKSILLFTVLFLPTALVAQSPKSALGGDGTLWAGAEFSDFNPDFGCPSNWVFNCSHELYGVGAFFDFNVTSKIGAEGETRWLDWNGRAGQSESTYLIGPRYRVYRHGRYRFWVKTLLGGGWTTTPHYPEAGSLKGSYYVFTPGGTFGYRLSYHLQLQADYEYQFWPSFAGPPTFNSAGQEVLHNGGLSPNGVSVGFAWRFLGQ